MGSDRPLARSGVGVADLRVHSLLRIEQAGPAAGASAAHLDRDADPPRTAPASRVQRCMFEDARGCLVQLGAWEYPYLDAAAREFDGAWRQDLGNLVFDGCQFLSDTVATLKKP